MTIGQQQLERDCPVWYESRRTCSCVSCTLLRVEIATNEEAAPRFNVAWIFVGLLALTLLSFGIYGLLGALEGL